MEHKDDNQKYSPLVNGIQRQFNHYCDEGYAALFVCASAWDTPDVSYIAVPEKIWPWAVLDHSDAIQNDATMTPIIAFDLRREFDAQMPEHLRRIEVFDCFRMNPLINIPDRTGIVPADKQRAFQQQALQERPARPTHLRLVKG